MHTDEIDPARVYRFSEFELNVRTRQLLRRGRAVAIQPKPFDLLVYLLRHRDRLVPREELLSEVWGGVHVDDEAVRFTLHAARKAVDDDGSRQEVIRTVPRAGFRLVAEVEEVAAPIIRLTEESSRTPFLGRDRLMERATSMLGEVAAGESRVLLLSGEAGIGKTRAVEQISDLAERLGFKVFRGRCVESEGAPGFWPWVQVLRAAVSSDPPDNLLRALGEGAGEVAWMVPELRPYVSDLPQTSSVDARAARFLMFDSVVAFFRELTRARPHVVSIDDLHRADAASVALFQHVARELGHAEAPNLLLVGTYREGELRVGPLQADSILSLATLPQSAHELLRGLERDDVRKLLEALSGRVPGSSVVDDLHEKTLGNPFFLHQIIGVLRSERRLAELESSESVEPELPRHVQDVIRRQLDLLPGSTRELIELAAVVGGEFSVGELELSADLDRAAVFARIGVARDAGVVTERPAEADRYRFHHALVRDAIYAGLDRDLRGRLHARVARALEQRTPAEPSEHSASIAHHYEQSSDREDRIRAVHFYEMAASWSSARGAFEDTPEHLERALSLIDYANPRTLVQRCRLLLRLGDAWGDAGMRDRARDALQKAAALASRAGLREELATAALRYAPDLLALEAGIYDAEMVRLLEEAIENFRGPSLLRARLLARLAIALQWSDDERVRGRSLCAEANELVAPSSDKDARGYVTTISWVVNFLPNEPGIEPLNVTPCSDDLEIFRRVLRVTAFLTRGEIGEADAEVTRLSDVIDRSKRPQARWYVGLMRTIRAEMEGRFEQADKFASEYYALGRQYADRNAFHSYEALYAMRSFDIGGIERFESRVRYMVDAFPRMVAWRAGLAYVLAELNRNDEARFHLHQVASKRALSELTFNEWNVTTALMAMACTTVGDKPLASELYNHLLPHADHLVVFGYCTYCLGSTHWLLGRLASLLREWRLADQHFRVAIATNSIIGARACTARAYIDHAQMLVAAGKRSDALIQASSANEIASALGMLQLARKSQELGLGRWPR